MVTFSGWRSDGGFDRSFFKGLLFKISPFIKEQDTGYLILLFYIECIMTYQKKYSLVTLMRRRVVFLLILLASIMVIIDIVSTYHSAEIHAKQMRADFIKQQKQQIKYEVDRISKIINFQLARTTGPDEKTTQKKHEEIMQRIVEQHVSEHRFGLNKLGYIFIYKALNLQGGKDFAVMYANPNRPDLVGKYISDDFKDAKGKMFRKEFLQRLRTHGECYVNYWYKKFDHPEPSPKTSYFKLTDDREYIIAAGMYLDDIEHDIAVMMKSVNAELKIHITIFSAAGILTILFFLYLLNNLSNRVRNNFELFTDFFKQTVHSDEIIDRSLIRYAELDQLAEYANQMLYEKTAYLKSLEQYKQLLDQICLVSKGNLGGDITYANDNFCEISGYSREELIGQPHSIIRHPGVPASIYKKMWDKIQAGETWRDIIKNKAKDGQVFYVDTVIAPLVDQNGTILEYISARYDITELLENRNEVKLAFATDNLTSLASRHKLIQDINSTPNDKCLLLLDVDDFSGINKQLGIDESDRLLRYLSHELMNFFTNEDCPHYRLHGDIFAILSMEQNQIELAQQCQLFFKHLTNHPFTCANGEALILTLVGGLACAEKTLLSCADSALQNAKKNNLPLQIYSQELDSLPNEGRTYWINQVQLALQENRLFPHYQPIVHLASGQVDKYESLMRMVDRDGKIVSPGEFLPILEQTRYYPQMTQSIVQQACRFFSSKKVSFSVNLSVDDLLQQKTVEFVIATAKRYKVMDRLVIEVVETQNVQNYDVALQSIDTFKSLGMKIAIDDFGSGYANFSYLSEFPADFVKIDGSLISKVNSDSKTHHLVKMLIDYAHNGGMEVIAEFVSDAAILKSIKELGCDYGQGYYLGRPVPGEEIS